MTSYPLAPQLDGSAAVALQQALRDRLDSRQPLLLDGSTVARVGQACLQVLVAARQAAEAEGLRFAIAEPSETLCDMAGLARLDAVLEPTG